MKTLIKLFGFKILTTDTVRYYSHNDRKWMCYTEVYLFGRLWDIDYEPLWI